jgi:hypothetical protein
MLNGIEEIVTRPDLADRAVFLTLEPIPEKNRRPEAELWAAFETEHPRLLGVLLDAVVEGIRRLPDVRLEKLPRMADFALWATACETALWPTGTFSRAYLGNRDDAVESVIDADPIATAVRALMAKRTGWTGTAADLLVVLSKLVGDRNVSSKNWPDTPRALSGRLRRAATFLRKIGIEVGFGREGQARTRTITIVAEPSQPSPANAGTQPSIPSIPSVPFMSTQNVGLGGRSTPSAPLTDHGHVVCEPLSGEQMLPAAQPDAGVGPLRTVRTQNSLPSLTG